MKKIFLLFLLSIVYHTLMGQTPEELKQLKQLYESQSKNNEQTVQELPEIDRQRQGSLESTSASQLSRPKTGADNSVYGKNIFSNENLSFAPNLNAPTPQNYILGSGDELIIDIWGEAQENSSKKISPDGYITLTGVGPVQLSGLDIKDAEDLIRTKMTSKIESLTYGGSKLKLTLGNIRSIHPRTNIMGLRKCD